MVDIRMEIKYNIYTKVNYGGECYGYQSCDNERNKTKQQYDYDCTSGCIRIF